MSLWTSETLLQMPPQNSNNNVLHNMPYGVIRFAVDTTDFSLAKMFAILLLEKAVIVVEVIYLV